MLAKHQAVVVPLSARARPRQAPCACPRRLPFARPARTFRVVLPGDHGVQDAIMASRIALPVIPIVSDPRGGQHRMAMRVDIYGGGGDVDQGREIAAERSRRDADVHGLPATEPKTRDAVESATGTGFVRARRAGRVGPSGGPVAARSTGRPNAVNLHRRSRRHDPPLIADAHLARVVATHVSSVPPGTSRNRTNCVN